MRILVLGAGGTGGYFGGRLAEAGADVTFLLRPRRAEQIARDGLVVTSPHGDIRRQVRHVTGDTLDGPYEAILLTCKAYDLEDAMAAVAPAVGAETVIVPLLNGLRHLDTLDGRFGQEKVLGGLCLIAATLTPEGEVRHMDRLHGLVFGERDGTVSPRVAALAEILSRAKADGRASEAILQEMWEKFVMLCSLAAATTLFRQATGVILEAPEGAAILGEMLDECAAVAAASGYPPSGEFLDRIRAMLLQPGAPRTASMLRDLRSGGRVEADHVVGDMLQRARALGLPAPLLRLSYNALKAYEASRAA